MEIKDNDDLTMSQVIFTLFACMGFDCVCRSNRLRVLSTL